MIRLFGRGNRSDTPQDDKQPNRDDFRVTLKNFDDVYRRAMWLAKHPDVEEADRRSIKQISAGLDSAGMNLKYGKRGEADESLRRADKAWREVGRRYERQAYPERYSTDKWEVLGITEINGASLVSLRSSDPLFLYTLASGRRFE